MTPLLALRHALPFGVQLALLAVLALLVLPIAWRGYVLWWDFWNGGGAFYRGVMPEVR